MHPKITAANNICNVCVLQQQWCELVFWMMLWRACTMLRNVGSVRSWSGPPQKWSSNFCWWCKSMVECHFNLLSTFNCLITSNYNAFFLPFALQDTLVNLSLWMITGLVKLWLNWMEDWTNVGSLVLALMWVSRRLKLGLQGCSLQDRSVPKRKFQFQFTFINSAYCE